ncbi:MAG: BON domain-containing protein [Nitrospira sp.]|nr:BON domain-containing protein [Nitrospira sp.]
MIRGKVDSDAAKQAAEGIAKGIDGVKTVKNDLQVVAPSKREATDDKDDAITARVHEHRSDRRVAADGRASDGFSRYAADSTRRYTIMETNVSRTTPAAGRHSPHEPEP